MSYVSSMYIFYSPGLYFHVERLLEQRLGHVASQRGADLGVAGRVLHHIRHPLLPGDRDGVDRPGTRAHHVVGLLPEGLDKVRHVGGVLLVNL